MSSKVYCSDDIDNDCCDGGSIGSKGKIWLFVLVLVGVIVMFCVLL